MRQKVNPNISKINGLISKTLSQDEQRHLSVLLDTLKTKFGIEYPVSDISSRIGSVTIIKMREGGRAIRVVSADGFSATYPVTTEELRCHDRMQREAANAYLRQLAILRITHEDATQLTNRIKELTSKSTGSITLPLRQSDYNPEQAKAFTAHQCTVLYRLIPRDTSSTHSANRELEVGKQSRYDHIDNQQSGSQLTMYRYLFPWYALQNRQLQPLQIRFINQNQLYKLQISHFNLSRSPV